MVFHVHVQAIIAAPPKLEYLLRRPYGMTRSSQSLHDDKTMRGNLYSVDRNDRASSGPDHKFVTQTLTRDLFAVAN